MTIKTLASKVALLEGKKVQTPVGNIREILSILCDLIYSDPEVLVVLLLNGRSRKRNKRSIV